MNELRVALQKAIAGERIVVSAANVSALRQRFYRYREKIRSDLRDPLNLLVEDIKMEILGENLIITYEDPTIVIRSQDNEHRNERENSRPGANGAAANNDHAPAEKG